VALVDACVLEFDRSSIGTVFRKTNTLGDAVGACLQRANANKIPLVLLKSQRPGRFADKEHVETTAYVLAPPEVEYLPGEWYCIGIDGEATADRRIDAGSKEPGHD